MSQLARRRRMEEKERERGEEGGERPDLLTNGSLRSSLFLLWSSIFLFFSLSVRDLFLVIHVDWRRRRRQRISPDSRRASEREREWISTSRVSPWYSPLITSYPSLIKFPSDEWLFNQKSHVTRDRLDIYVSLFTRQLLPQFVTKHHLPLSLSLSLPFLCIFHFRYNDAKRHTRVTKREREREKELSTASASRTVWKHHCNQAVILSCGKSLWTIHSFIFSFSFLSLCRCSLFSPCALDEKESERSSRTFLSLVVAAHSADELHWWRLLRGASSNTQDANGRWMAQNKRSKRMWLKNN